MEEPSVLDYLKSVLSFRKDRQIPLPWQDETADEDQAVLDSYFHTETEMVELQAQVESPPLPVVQPMPGATWVIDLEDRDPEAPAGSRWPDGLSSQRTRIPWRALGGVLLALAGQQTFEPPRSGFIPGLVLYTLAAGLILWSALAKEWVLAPHKPDSSEEPSMEVYRGSMLLLIPLALLIFASFILFDRNRFTALNLMTWGLAIGLLVWMLWIPSGRTLKSAIHHAKRFFRRPVLDIRLTGWTVLLVAVCALVIFFRFYQLNGTPAEMFSDHFEKLADVNDILNGQFSIFFPRNTGREAIQMYLTAFIAIFAGTGLSYLSLKLGTALIGLLTLPYVYLLGKEVGNRWVGLLALLMAGVAYWPNVISRVGLRFPLYPLFVAPVLYYLLRGLRRSSRNDFILAGLFLGLGLHGYSPFRIMPFIVLFMVGLYLLHAQSRGKRLSTLSIFVLLGIVAVVVFLPLFRYMLANPQMFNYRALSRLTSQEVPLPGPVLQILFQNLWNSQIMFFWSDGETWVNSIVGRPALDVVSAALFMAGEILLLVRYIRRRHWLDLFLLLSVPLLMLPSSLSLAFPNENPSLNRSGGALIPVFVTIALAFEGLLAGLARSLRGRLGQAAALGLACVLILVNINQNYSLVFDQYSTRYRQNAWNYSEIGQVIRSYATSVGSFDTAYVVPFAYWVDTSVIGITANNEIKNYALWRDQIAGVQADPRSKLFIVYPPDRDTLTELEKVFPDGRLIYHQSTTNSGKDFWMFLVPPVTSDVTGPAIP